MTSSSILKPSAINFFSQSSLSSQLATSSCSRNSSYQRLFRRLRSFSSVSFSVNFLVVVVVVWFIAHSIKFLIQFIAVELDSVKYICYVLLWVAVFSLEPPICFTNLSTVLLKTFNRLSSCISRFLLFGWRHKFQFLMALSKYLFDFWKTRLTSIKSSVRFINIKTEYAVKNMKFYFYLRRICNK